MYRRFATACVVTGLLTGALADRAQAQGRGKPPAPANIAVTSELAGGNDVIPFELRSDDQGPYVSADGIVTQIYGSSGDWELDLSQQSVRGIDLTFTTVDSTPAAVPSGRYNARLISRCFAADGTITGYQAIAEGSANTRCAMRVNFSAGGTSYSLVMSPLYAGTTWVTVTCLPDGDANVTCDSWSAAPDAAAANPIAALYRVSRSKESFLGYYVLNFAMTATR